MTMIPHSPPAQAKAAAEAHLEEERGARAAEREALRGAVAAAEEAAQEARRALAESQEALKSYKARADAVMRCPGVLSAHHTHTRPCLLSCLLSAMPRVPPSLCLGLYRAARP